MSRIAYSKEEKEILKTKYLELTHSGMGKVKAAAECGVAYLTLEKWIEEKDNDPLLSAIRDIKTEFKDELIDKMIKSLQKMKSK